jgi:hypothetical protein
MALVQRPRFYEGQVLGAADLTAGLEYARSQEARHDRVVHTWGIADGLTLATAQQPGYVTVSVSAGLALDGTGREVLVPDAVQLDEKLFASSNVAVADATALYPVLIAGADTPALPGMTTQRCSPQQASRTVESYKLSFGAPGAELALSAQTAPAIDQGAGGGVNQLRWWILLGYVSWDVTTSHFTGVANTSNGIGRRYVGLRSSYVTAQGDAFTLQASTAMARLAMTGLGVGNSDARGNFVPALVARTDGTLQSDTGALVLRSGASDVAGKPILTLTETANGGTLAFGLQGSSSQLMTIDELGNLSIAGMFSGLAPGTVKIASGIASDGAIVPLPDGITDALVQAGKVTLYWLATAQPGGAAPATASVSTSTTWICSPIEASIDAARRVHATNRWIGFSLTGGTPLVETAAGNVSYLMCAVTATS